MSELIQSFEQNYHLGVAEMDETHRQFVAQVNQLDAAPDATFSELFAELLKHTEAHFAAENELMKTSGFPPIHIHMGEHQRVLEAFKHFAAQVAAGDLSVGRAFIHEQIPRWFELHSRTMDSALAAHLKRVGQS
ncbi:bacteriohemerythrin [Candidatus Venteria ishoeyi]|uniref:Cation-binding hemerythrin HHE family protein n=1 Tax=Candidatus Venteria ishoeyi TaxID=1899563 RepID=A0A1H6FFB5_9GAMM|nr:hemerythrin domain-containing protein [Candidatus Venteria ishoeyi]SEH08717.1 cation-binding hemerythrin HHE family protein [Candidatus Venteria ishoeyi]